VPDSDVWLARARAAAATGDDDAAKAEYLALISHDPTHLAALLELAALAERTGHRSAAQTAYQQAVTPAPDNQLARTGLANLLRDSGETATAEAN
jgi:Tfp pilus assembly protein PilF